MLDEFNDNVDETFQEPKKRFWQRTSRKRPKSEISISSMDTSMDSSIMQKTKRRRITEFASNLLQSSASKNKITNRIQRSLGLQNNSSIGMIDEEDSGPSKRTRSKCEHISSLTINSWLVDVASHCSESEKIKNLSKTEIKRQEAIYELYCGENVYLNDLENLKNTYFEPLRSTDIFTSNEMRILFGDIDMFIHIHSKLRDDLLELRDEFGFVDCIGPVLLEWIPTLMEPYIERCKSQIMARHLLDEKRIRNKKFQEFTKRKMELPHAIDLWTYLDIARSRIVKYPILINEIHHRTSSTHEDFSILKEAKLMFKNLLEEIDRAMGDAECELARSKIIIKHAYDPDDNIMAAKDLITEGQLKNSRGIKLHCFIFNTCLVLTRRLIKSRKKRYNLVYPVIPVQQLTLSKTTDNRDDDASGDSNDGNSVNNINKCEFKISNRTFSVKNEHVKRHWIDAIEKVKRLSNDQTEKTNHNEFERILKGNHQLIKSCTRERPI